MKFPHNICQGRAITMDCQDYITEPAERKKGQHLQREERGAIQHLKGQGYQTEPSPERSVARRPPWQTNCGSAHRLERAIRAGNPATQQGVERPSTRPTGSVLEDAIGFTAAPASFVGWQGSSKNTSGLWMPASVMPVCTSCSQRTRWYARTPCITRSGLAISTFL